MASETSPRTLPSAFASHAARQTGSSLPRKLKFRRYTASVTTPLTEPSASQSPRTKGPTEQVTVTMTVQAELLLEASVAVMVTAWSPTPTMVPAAGS